MMKKYAKISYYSKIFSTLLEKENIKYLPEYEIKNTEIKNLLTKKEYSEVKLNVNRYFDFYLPEYNLLIELNTLFTHCLPIHEECHKLKRDLAKNLHKKILFIWDSHLKEYKFKNDEISLFSRYNSLDFHNSLKEVVKYIKDNKDYRILHKNFKEKNNFYYSDNIENIQKRFLKAFQKKKTIDIEQAEKMWPEWYQRRIINKEEPRKYIFKRTLYEWWLRKCRAGEEVKVGHRYYCALVLVSFATKCGISKEELTDDLNNLINIFNEKTIDKNNSFTKQDVEDALNYYNTEYVLKFTRLLISELTGIEIKPTKRNGLKQKDHLKIARFTKEIKRKSLNIKGYNSNPYKTETMELIKSYVESGKYKSIIEISKETGLNRKTVTKYYNKLKNELNDKNLNIKEQNIYNLLKKNPKMSCNKISKETNISYVTVKKYYNNIKNIIDAEIKKEEFWENLID